MSTPGAAAALRSWLFVPGDSERKQTKALASAADALILDLEDSVDPAQRPAARARIAALLASATGAGPQLWVRVSAPGGETLAQDLAQTCVHALPAGIVLPKVSCAQEIIAAAERLAALGAARGASAGRVRLLALVTETAAGLLALPQYPQLLAASAVTRAHLAGLTWGAEDLSAALGAGGKRDRCGTLTFTFQLARVQCLLAAAALEVMAVDGVHTEFRDTAALQRELEDARRDGFGGKLAIHPGQVAPINAAFTPTEAEREHARRVLAAFAAAGNCGVASLDGQMIDRPHLLQAQRILAAPKP
ncbi:MAG TPA: CoA ester lyase [Steroidobacteraceae bacterium]|nr:CoA ester lyase [Steroidobacteraceae bacterium]